MAKVQDEDDREVEVFEETPDFDGPQADEGRQDTIEEAAGA